MNSKAYILGFLVGMAVVLLACLALRIYIKRKTNMNRYEYDERQKAIQGPATNMPT